ncbi:nutritionally-regulated adipose and cardiac enriched protein homolog isoform X2 [Hyla sarda]|uniref:nutritionally-regulated adipose and cardiac enriched protein homolog isoform X2 n=1 Tax=Hyla sarda TaxID=327740 RepID=UPI0024C22350|nr:nutritionally-regulated adipose and cardiac enriched protein homolog isoform X2 [Hyla sarda]
MTQCFMHIELMVEQFPMERAKMPPSILRRRTVDKEDEDTQHKSERRVHFRNPEAIYIHASHHCSGGLQLPVIIGVCILTILGLIFYCHDLQLGSNTFNSSFVVFILRLKHNAAICWKFLKEATMK